ncbi:MAG TPA: hypothetical protein VNJ04_18325 [Gemmatimonadaceae bacterium]|nr:hypothetical protein [Gemmatimonadaceae bacterium]
MKKIALLALFLSMVAMGVAYAAAIVTGTTEAWSAWVLAIATSIAMTATMTIGAVRTGKRNGGLGRLIVPFAIVLVILLGAFTLALTLPAAGEPLLLGVPRRAAIVLYGIGLLPLFILPAAYALTFDEMTLTEDDLARVREAAARAGEQR